MSPLKVEKGETFNIFTNPIIYYTNTDFKIALHALIVLEI